MDKPKLELGFSFDFKENKDILFLVLSFLVSSAFMYLYVSASYKDYLVFGENIESKKDSLVLREGLLSDIEALGENDIEVERKINKIRSLVSNRDNYEDFGVHITQLATRDGISVTDFDISEVEGSSTGFKEGEISFSAVGDYHSFLHFLEELENGIPFVQDKSIVIARESKMTDSGYQLGSEVDLYPVLSYEVELTFIHN